MHDCRRTQEKLPDALFNELAADEKLRVLAEIKDCSECHSQYESLAETLSLFDEAVEATLPTSESYWLAYDERLRRRLDDPRSLQLQPSPERASLWRRALLMRVQVPVPALAAAALVVIASLASLLTLRPLRANAPLANTQSTSPSLAGSINPPSESPARIVEVPVDRERIITRIIYINKKQTKETRRNNSDQLAGANKQMLAARSAPLPTMPLSLAGFQPTDDVKITVIKSAEDKR